MRKRKKTVGSFAAARVVSGGGAAALFVVLGVCVCVSAHAPPAAQIHLLYSLPNPLAPESGIGFSCLVSGAMLRTVWHGVSMWSHPEGQGYRSGLTLKVRNERMDIWASFFGQIRESGKWISAADGQTIPFSRI